MYTLERLLRDATARIAALQSRSVDLAEVWEAFNKYLGQVIEKRQTLQVLNTLTIGWKFLEAGPGGAGRLLPTFHLSEAFAASTGVNTRRHPVVADRLLTAREEFNCSKAAIRFSQSLTKDQVFMGLRAILHQLGEAMASGQPCSIDFEVGKLLCTERQIQFAFAADVYLREGLKVPEESKGVEYKPSVTFGLPSQDALTLRLDGTAASLAQTQNVQAMTMGGWAERGEGDREQYPAGAESGEDGDSECSTRGDVYVPEASFDPPEDLRAEDWRATEQRQELVYRDAIERRMDDAIREAAEVDGDRENWEEHLRRCVEEDQRELEWRKAIALDHQSRLLGQMQEAEVKRLQDRQFRLEQASKHEFPDFTKYTEKPTYDYMHRLRQQLKNELVDQIEQKQFMNAQDKQMERNLEVAHLQLNRQLQTEESNQAIRKKEKMALAMTENWALNLQFKEAQKAIDDHHKAPSKAKLNETMTALAGSGLGPATPRSPVLLPAAASRQQATPRQATARLQPQATPRPQRPATPGQPQETQKFQMDSPPSSRPVTGSVRRMPLGAAGSLALHKQKMASALRPKDYTKLQSGSLS